MKVMAISAGRPRGNTELMAKAALKVCQEEYGAQVVYTSLTGKNITPCCGCESCTLGMYVHKKYPHCIFESKDDMKAIMDEWDSSDAVIFAIPSYFQQIPGIVKVFTDRLMAYERGNMKNCGIIDQVPKKIVGLMCVGGSAQSWHSLTLDQLHAALTGQSVKVVDKYIFTRCAASGHVLVEDEKLERVRRLARNVAEACLMDYDSVSFRGDDYKALCPVCHSNLISLAYPHWDGATFTHECAVCGTGGELAADENGVIRFQVAPNGTVHCRAFTEGRVNHVEEIQSAHAKALERRDEIEKRRAAALEYKPRTI